MILGSGPNRIGQGIEFDYCCVHAAMTVRDSGRDAVMINCNPETVSTDYDTSDRLYFEPLTRRGRPRRDRGRAARGRDRPVRRPDAAAARARARGGRRAAPGHARRRDRPGRGPRSLRRAPAPARDRAIRPTGQRSRPRRRRSSPRTSASPCWCGPRTSSAAGRWRSVTRPRASTAYLRGARQGRPGAPAAARPVPRGCDRGGRGRALRRDRRGGRRDHAARRGGRRPLGRLGLRAPADEPRRRDARPDPRDDDAGSRSSSG